MALGQPRAGSGWRPRLAGNADIPDLEALVARSVRALQRPYYSPAQIKAAIGNVFGVDTQLIRDGTYFVVENDRLIVGCGGWSRRASLFGSDRGRGSGDPELDPGRDPARIRAFFVEPAWARRGVAASIMVACERAIVDAGFRSAVIVSTLAGEPLYASFGYRAARRYEVPMAGALTLPVVTMEKAFSGPVHPPQKPGSQG